MPNALINVTCRILREQGIAYIPAYSDIPTWFDVYPGESVKPAILDAPTQYGLNPDFHAIWCMSTDDAHITPCEGEWDIRVAAGNGRMAHEDDMLPKGTLSMTQAVNGDVLVEIRWDEAYDASDPETGKAIETTLNNAIPRVLASIRHNRLQHLM